MPSLFDKNDKPFGLDLKLMLMMLALVIFILWTIQPYMKTNTSVKPHEYYEYGTQCLNHYMQVTDQENYKLFNTYAKTVSDNKDVVVIQAKNLEKSIQIAVKCSYEENKLSSLSVDNEVIRIEKELELTK